MSRWGGLEKRPLRKASGAPGVILEDLGCRDPAVARPHSVVVGVRDPGRATLDSCCH